MFDEPQEDRFRRQNRLDALADASRCLRRHLVAKRKGITWAASGFERAYERRVRLMSAVYPIEI